MVLTEPGLAGVVSAVREGRIGFQRLLTYTLNMLVKKVEIVLLLAAGLVLTGHAVLTPVLIVLMLLTNDLLAMSLTTDRGTPSATPSRWRMRNITAAAVVLGFCKLMFTTSLVALAKFRLGLSGGELQTLAFVALVFGNQAVMYVVRERGHMWSSRPSGWVLASSAVDIAIVSLLALSGVLMEPLPGRLIAMIFIAAIGFGLVLDQIKKPILSLFKVG